MTEFRGSYIEKVSQYSATSGFSAIMPTMQSGFSSSSMDERVDSWFSVFGDNSKIEYSRFASIVRPGNTKEHMINMSAFDEVLEVLDLCNYIGNTELAAQEISNLANDPESAIPWNLSNMQPYKESYEEAIWLEFETPQGIIRPDGSLCPSCGHDRIYRTVGQTRSIDEGLTEEVICSQCGADYSF